VKDECPRLALRTERPLGATDELLIQRAGERTLTRVWIEREAVEIAAAMRRARGRAPLGKGAVQVGSDGAASYARLLTRYAKLDLLAIDDSLLAPLTDAERRDLLEVIEDGSERASTLIASQLPSTAWHAAIGEPSVADAICDRLIHRAHRLTLRGPTMRDPGTRRGKATT
jgi:hypothetical protein